MVSVTLAPKTPEEKRAIEDAITQELIQRGVKKGIIKSAEEAYVRDIFVTLDLGESTESWEKEFTSTGWQARFSDVKVDDNKIIAFYGVQIQQTTKIVTAVRFKRGKGGTAKTVGMWHLEHLYGKEEQEGISDQVIIYENGEYINIDFYIKETGTAKVILLGKTLEPVGTTVSP